MTGMEIFNLIEGIFSIIASITAIVTAACVFKIKKYTKTNIDGVNEKNNNIGFGNKTISSNIVVGGNVNEK